eukprot:c1467_g1_i1.p1 GENE.c1467_g1_i1~~c1467_g1_i1.p1  ORF type:complete len:171 (+),score=32.12 c1467_g1_i1:54-515(+)
MSDTQSSQPKKAKKVQGKAAPGPAALPIPQSGLSDELLSRRRLQDLLSEISQHDSMEPEVERALMDIAEDFVESVTSFSCQLARHRNSNILEAKDIRLHLEKNWNLRVPGFTHPEDLRVPKRKNMSDLHKQRLEQAKKVGNQSDQQNKKSKTA